MNFLSDESRNENWKQSRAARPQADNEYIAFYVIEGSSEHDSAWPLLMKFRASILRNVDLWVYYSKQNSVT